MSTNTPVFGLFQYNPITDGNLPFNITQALNNNWNAIDSLALPAAAAASPYNPSGTYAVGDYCTHGGGLHKCNTAIPDGEAWNAEHWTETTVAAELAEVRASLSNKVDVNPGYGNGIFGNDLNDWKRLGTFTTIGYNPDPVTQNVPPQTDGWGVVTVLSANNTEIAPTIQLFNPLNHIAGGTRPLFYRFFRDTWTEWEAFMFSTPPQEHEISFRSGWSNAAKSTYYKTQEGSCVVNCAVYGTGVASDNFIATLPAGFRPNATVCRAAHAHKGGIRGIAEAQIAANGDIVIYSPIEFDYVSFGATFLAQN